MSKFVCKQGKKPLNLTELDGGNVKISTLKLQNYVKTKCNKKSYDKSCSIMFNRVLDM